MNSEQSDILRKSRFSLRSMLLIIVAVTIVLSVLLWRAKTRRRCFGDLRNQGAIVNYSKSIWGATFDEPAGVKFFANIEGDNVRIGNKLYSSTDAEAFFLKQKSLANEHGFEGVQFFVTKSPTRPPSGESTSKMVNFGMKTFGDVTFWGRDSADRMWRSNRTKINRGN